MYPWSSWRTLVPLVLCGVSLALFIVYEEWLSRVGREPIIRTSVFKNRTAAVTFFTTVIRKSTISLSPQLALLNVNSRWMHSLGNLVLFAVVLRGRERILANSCGSGSIPAK